MKNKIKLDDFLKTKLDDDSVFEYTDSDWAKAEQLLYNANQKRVSSSYSILKLAITLSVIIGAVLTSKFYFVNKATDFQNHIKNNVEQTNKVVNEKNELNERVVINSTNYMNEKNMRSLKSHKLKSKHNSDFVVHSSLALQNSNKEKHATNNKKYEGKMLMKNNSNEEYVNGSDFRFKNKQIALVRLELKQLNLNKQLNIDSQFLQDTFSKHISYNRLTNELNSEPEFAVKRKLAFEFVIGTAFYKQFGGNTSHNNTPSINPYLGLTSNFFLTRKSNINLQINYAQRGGTNLVYPTTIDKDKYAKLSVQKIYMLDFPLFLSYSIAKNSLCTGGVGASVIIGSKINNLTQNDNTLQTSTKGLIRLDYFITMGYKYFLNDKLSVTTCAQIGFRDFTNNAVFNSKSKDDNVSLKLGINYMFVNH